MEFASDIYDRAGNPITLGRWLDLRHDYDYQVLRKTVVGGVWEVSTVWLGTDHSFGLGPPLIFETMVFELAESHGYAPPTYAFDGYAYTYHESVMGGYQVRYSTETEAIAGHECTIRRARQAFLPMRI